MFPMSCGLTALPPLRSRGQMSPGLALCNLASFASTGCPQQHAHLLPSMGKPPHVPRGQHTQVAEMDHRAETASMGKRRAPRCAMAPGHSPCSDHHILWNRVLQASVRHSSMPGRMRDFVRDGSKGLQCTRIHVHMGPPYTWQPDVAAAATCTCNMHMSCMHEMCAAK